MMNQQELIRFIQSNTEKIKVAKAELDEQSLYLLRLTTAQYGYSQSDLSKLLSVTKAHISQVLAGKKRLGDQVRQRLIRLLTINVCLSCGIETTADICPNGCKSQSDPEQGKPTLPVRQIPTHCWDCGTELAEPPHKRKYLGQCPRCTKIQAIGQEAE